MFVSSFPVKGSRLQATVPIPNSAGWFEMPSVPATQLAFIICYLDYFTPPFAKLGFTQDKGKLVHLPTLKHELWISKHKRHCVAEYFALGKALFHVAIESLL